MSKEIAHPVLYGDLVYKLRRVANTPNFISSGSKIVKRLRRRQHDLFVIERTIGLVHGRHPPLIGHYTNFWPLMIWTLWPNFTYYLIVQGFHRTYATGAACQQRMLAPPDTWSCPTLGLAYILISRPIYSELVLFPDFWVLNIPRYFSFASAALYKPFPKTLHSG